MFDLITILGPTATGKTKLAALLSESIDGEIISADSRQIYKDMNIGTGKDLADYVVDGKQIPYHLVDVVEPGYEYNVFEFQNDFLKVYNQIKKRNCQAVLCGGTGLYLEAVLNGYKLLDVPKNKLLRQKLEHLSHIELTKVLRSYGPLHNTTDIVEKERSLRSIEINQYKKDHPAETKFPHIESLNIGIRFQRQTVRQRITDRLKQRLENGMIQEVEKLLQNGLKPKQLTFYGLEYRYVTRYVIGEIDYDTLFSQLNTAIHQFSKRQMTWFRRMEKKGTIIHWIDGQSSESEKVKICLRLIDEKKR